jgi:hypothetical protein
VGSWNHFRSVKSKCGYLRWCERRGQEEGGKRERLVRMIEDKGEDVKNNGAVNL